MQHVCLYVFVGFDCAIWIWIYRGGWFVCLGRKDALGYISIFDAVIHFVGILILGGA